MRYPNDKEVRRGDKVRFSDGSQDVAVFSIDTNEYSPEYPKEEWDYLQGGIMIMSERMGLVHYYEKIDSDIEFVEKGNKINL